MHILIVDPEPDRAQALRAALAGAGHQTELAPTAGAALAALARPTGPSVVLAADALPDMPVLDFLHAASAMGAEAPIVLLGPDAAAAHWLEARRLGAVDYVHDTEERPWLATLPARLLAARERVERRDRVHRMADALTSTAAAVAIADRDGRLESVNEALVQLLGRDPTREGRDALADLFLFEDAPGTQAEFTAAVRAGGEWAGELQASGRDADPVACMVTLSPIRRASGNVDGLVLTLRDVSDRVAMEEALRAANRRLADQAARDALTGLYNRGYFHEVLEREMARAQRYGDVLAVVMMDLDGFKQINDVHGHAAGDTVLTEVASLLRPHLRDGDVLARYGGDEFVALLPNTDGRAALTVAERLRAAVAERGYGPEATSRVTMSAGVATSEDVREVERSASDLLLRRADRALYEGKDAGGNRVTPWSTALDEETGAA
ncbi:MAG: sensor domain-containing diguanylate cyclase [Planctomycetota bacterium]|nr:sensor domain-containing diguanylate cyclase [Planctomycetota bacterium]